MNAKHIKDFLKDSLQNQSQTNENYRIISVPQSKLDKSPWQFNKQDISGTIPLSEICNIGKGVATGNDTLFVVNKKIAKDYGFEAEIIDQVVEDSSIDKYEFKLSENVLIRTKRGVNLSKYPTVENYLNEHKQELQKRYAVQKEGLKWFEIVRYNDDLFSSHVKEQIYAYYRSTYNKFAYSDKRFITLTTTFVLTSKNDTKINLKYVVGILNSKFIEDYSQKNAKKMGSCYEYSSNYISSIPIKIGTESQQQMMIQLVDKIIHLKKRINELGDTKTDIHIRLEEDMLRIDTKINDLVYKIYGFKQKRN